MRGEDRINLAALDANPGVAGNQAFSFVQSFGANASGQVTYAAGVISISTDADSAAEYQIKLAGIIPDSLSASDFIFVF